MKVTIEYMGFFNIEDVPNNSELEVPDGLTVGELLDRLDVKEEDRTYLVPLINRQRKDMRSELSDGDNLFLYFPVGGG
jgi:molybdopterin converting factor small subunit